MENVIEYNGQVLKTKYDYELSDEKFEELKKQYYASPDYDNVKKEFINISAGKTKVANITNYYYKDLMAKVRIYSCKWSIEDVFNCKPLLGLFYQKTFGNKKIFPDSHSDIKKIETAIRLGGKGYAKKPTNFPLKTANEILEKYNVNGNYYDYSCGWGIRLLAALKNNVNYYGTDPNDLLTTRLLNMAWDWKEVVGSSPFIDIRTQGSEVFNPDWENKIGLAFSSPPYFYLEDYKIGNQSYKEGVSYESWKENYLRKTMENIYKYLVDDGYFLININNFDKFALVEDTYRIALEQGFTYIESLQLDNIQRCNSNGGFNDNSEKILVFKK